MIDLTGQTAVVTGGAAGIGRAIATRLADTGAHVVVTDIADGTETVEIIEEAGGDAEFREADVTDEASMADAYEDLSIDVLVNNAGIWGPLVNDQKPFEEISVEEWNEIMEVNVTGVFIATKEALPHLEDGASVVNISSGIILSAVPGFLHYTTSKAAVFGMTRALANELGDENVHVNAVLPGLTASEVSLKSSEEKWDRIVDEQAIHRRIQPEDVADTVAFLASPNSGMITGQAITVDGGREFH